MLRTNPEPPAGDLIQAIGPPVRRVRAAAAAHDLSLTEWPSCHAWPERDHNSWG